MSAAIVTRFVGPTDHRGARIVATVPERLSSARQYGDAARWRLTVPYPYDLDPLAAHRAAAVALAQRLVWPDTFVSGALADGYAWVVVGSDR